MKRLEFFVLNLLLVASFAFFNLLGCQKKENTLGVIRTMGLIGNALVCYETDHYGCYPFSDDANDFWNAITCYLPGGEPFGADGNPLPGNWPNNPFTGKPYRPGKDIFYCPNGLKSAYEAKILNSNESDCPYNNIKTKGPSGTIIVFTFTDSIKGSVRYGGYAICGFGKNTNQPIADIHDNIKKYLVFILEGVGALQPAKGRR
ncbi:MAG: hypothetical protein ABIK93_01555 [candidate division WOR-3 bacterium]